jgi:hypothetical protein
MTGFDDKIGYSDIFDLGQIYRLDLKWSGLLYDNDGNCLLNNAYFSGPVLKIANKIEPDNEMILDFYKQYFVMVKSAYIVKLSWTSVEYSGNTVKISNALLKKQIVGNYMPSLNNDDYIVIDTNGHEDSNHMNSVVYNSFVIDKNNILYNFFDRG